MLHRDDQADMITLGLAAVEIGGGLQHHHVSRLCQRGRVPHQRAGRLRLIRRADLEKLRAAAIAAGYITETSGAAR
jgi:hypothetical protein